MWLPELGSPESTADRDDVELGTLDCTTDGGGNFLACLPAEAKVACTVTNGNECLAMQSHVGRNTKQQTKGAPVSNWDALSQPPPINTVAEVAISSQKTVVIVYSTRCFRAGENMNSASWVFDHQVESATNVGSWVGLFPCFGFLGAVVAQCKSTESFHACQPQIRPLW